MCTPLLESAQDATSVMVMRWMKKNHMDWVKKNQTDQVNAVTVADPQNNMVNSYTLACSQLASLLAALWLLYNAIAIYCSYLCVVHYNYVS